jgi:DegT/DnrJ/EryC1/StrS aminotransferase family
MSQLPLNQLLLCNMTAYSSYTSKDYVIQGSSVKLDTIENAWEAISGRMRTSIRKAQKSSVVIKTIDPQKESIEEFKAFCLNNDDIPEVFTDRYHVFFAYEESVLIAGIIVVAIEEKLFMLCHASTKRAKELEIPSLLIWHVIQQFCGKEWKYLDVGASYRHSLQKYFSGWRTKGYPIIMNPPTLLPHIYITPFDNQAMSKVIEDNPSATQKILSQKFGKPYTFFPRAQFGIFTLIRYLKKRHTLQNDDSVWITTTTDSPYVSSCVTSAIEQSLPWTREYTNQTKIIFCIHEFGFPHPKLQELRHIANTNNILLIEDCAYGFSTHGIGNVGDYAIYSLTKAFPVQFGGYVTGIHIDHTTLWQEYGCSDQGKQEYVEKNLYYWLEDAKKDAKKRRENFQWYESEFNNDSVFTIDDTIDPGVFMLKMPSEQKMHSTAEFVRRFGIECGTYWHNNAIFVPVHQRLSSKHLEYIAGSIFATKREWCGVPNPPKGI